MGVVYLAPFDFDHEFSSVSVRHPTLELGLLGCWYSQEIVNTLGYGAKYGHLVALPRWVCMLLPLVAGLLATLKEGSPFVPYSDQLKDVPLWRRRWSFTEGYAILANALLFMYIPTDVLLVADGQYQDDRLLDQEQDTLRD